MPRPITLRTRDGAEVDYWPGGVRPTVEDAQRAYIAGKIDVDELECWLESALRAEGRLADAGFTPIPPVWMLDSVGPPPKPNDAATSARPPRP